MIKYYESKETKTKKLNTPTPTSQLTHIQPHCTRFPRSPQIMVLVTVGVLALLFLPYRNNNTKRKILAPLFNSVNLLFRTHNPPYNLINYNTWQTPEINSYCVLGALTVTSVKQTVVDTMTS